MQTNAVLVYENKASTPTGAPHETNVSLEDIKCKVVKTLVSVAFDIDSQEVTLLVLYASLKSTWCARAAGARLRSTDVQREA